MEIGSTGSRRSRSVGGSLIVESVVVESAILAPVVAGLILVESEDLASVLAGLLIFESVARVSFAAVELILRDSVSRWNRVGSEEFGWWTNRSSAKSLGDSALGWIGRWRCGARLSAIELSAG